MLLWNNAPHRCSLYAVASGQDGGGGNSLAYTLLQADVPCLVNTTSAAEMDEFGQMQIRVRHVIGIKAALLTATPTRGVKAVVDGASYHVEGVRNGRAVLQTPAFCYLDCTELL